MTSPATAYRPPLRAVPAPDERGAREAREREAPHAWDHDDEAERAVLATALLDNATWARIGSALTTKDFYRAVHGVIFEAMGRLAGRGEALDVVTLAAELRRHERLNTVGGAQYLGEITDRLTSEIATTGHVESHLLIVLDAAARRSVAQHAEWLAQRARDPGRPIGATLAGVQVSLSAVAVPGAVTPVLGDDADGLCEEYHARVEGSAAPALSTGIRDLDWMLGGGLRPQHVILAGLPGTRKTTLALQIALHVAARSGPVYFWSKEMERRELSRAAWAHLARVNFEKIRDPRNHPPTQAEVDRLGLAVQQLERLPLHVADESTPGCPQTVPQIVAAVRGMKTRPALVVVDNLGELKPRGRHATPADGTAEIMDDLRAARKLLGVPILTLGHVGRVMAQGQQYRRPRPSDIAGGSAVEKKCDGMILIHCEDMHPTPRKGDDGPVVPGRSELWTPKFRGIPFGMCCLDFVSAQQSFVSVRGRDDMGPPVAATSLSPDAFDAGEGLPMDGAPVFHGETAALPLAPGLNADGTEAW